MSRRRILAVLIVATISLQSGCALMAPMRSSMKMFVPNTNGYRDGTNDVEDNWSDVGTEARGERKMDKTGPLDKLLMSRKARSIERNVGFDH